MLLERGQGTCALDTHNAPRRAGNVLPIAPGDRVLIGSSQEWFRRFRELFQRQRIFLAWDETAHFLRVGVELDRRLDLNATPQQVGLLFPLHDGLPLFCGDGDANSHDYDEEHQDEVGRAMQVAQSGRGEAHIRIE